MSCKHDSAIDEEFMDDELAHCPKIHFLYSIQSQAHNSPSKEYTQKKNILICIHDLFWPQPINTSLTIIIFQEEIGFS